MSQEKEQILLKDWPIKEIRPPGLLEVRKQGVELVNVFQSDDGLVHVRLPDRPLTPLEFCQIASTLHLAVLHLEDKT